MIKIVLTSLILLVINASVIALSVGLFVDHEYVGGCGWGVVCVIVVLFSLALIAAQYEEYQVDKNIEKHWG